MWVLQLLSPFYRYHTWYLSLNDKSFSELLKGTQVGGDRTEIWWTQIEPESDSRTYVIISFARHFLGEEDFRGSPCVSFTSCKNYSGWCEINSKLLCSMSLWKHGSDPRRTSKMMSFWKTQLMMKDKNNKNDWASEKGRHFVNCVPICSWNNSSSSHSSRQWCPSLFFQRTYFLRFSKKNIFA